MPKIDDIWIPNKGFLDNPKTYKLSVKENLIFIWIWNNGDWYEVGDKWAFTVGMDKLYDFFQTKLWNRRMTDIQIENALENLKQSGMIQYNESIIMPSIKTNIPKSRMQTKEFYSSKSYKKLIKDNKERQGIRLRASTYEYLMNNKISPYGMHLFKYILHRYGVMNLVSHKVSIEDLMAFMGLDNSISKRKRKKYNIIKGLDEIKDMGFIKSWIWHNSTVKKFEIVLNRYENGKQIYR